LGQALAAWHAVNNELTTLKMRLANDRARHDCIPGWVKQNCKYWPIDICPFDETASVDAINYTSIDIPILMQFLYTVKKDTGFDVTFKGVDLLSFPPEIEQLGYWGLRTQEVFSQKYTLADAATGFRSAITYTFPTPSQGLYNGSVRFPCTHTAFYDDVTGRDFDRRYDRYSSSMTGDCKKLYDRMTYEAAYRDEEIPRIQDKMNREEGLMLPSDTARSVLALHAAPGVQVFNCLEYIKANGTKLGERNWVNILHSLLFEKQLLLDEVQNPKRRAILSAAVQELFNHGFQNALRSKSYIVAANLLWICSNIQEYVTEASLKDGQEAPILVPVDAMKTLLEEAIKESAPDRLPVVFESVLASSGLLLRKDPQLLTPAEKEALGQVFLARCMCRSFVINQNDTCRPRADAANQAIMALKRLCTTGATSEIMKDHFLPVLMKLCPKLGIAAGDIPLGESDEFSIQGKFTVSLSSGYLVSPIANAFDFVPPTPLSPQIVDSLKGNKFYPKEADLSRVVCHTFVQADGAECTTFNDEAKGITFRFQRPAAGGGFTIYVQRKDVPGWWQFQPQNALAGAGEQPALCVPGMNNT
jgi:hypothetical protein